ncbi:serine O-acetyltransferase [Calothrix sp. NIES-4101]|nr:serine O-acetyltransferase [Calothrix sp. NIES-4101]
MQQSSLHNRNLNLGKKSDSAKKTFLQNLLSGLNFWSNIESIFEPVKSDFRIIFERDPAARSWLEVMLCYPGLHALCFHRVAHWLYIRQVALIPRLISHMGRFLTGIEIHPGAQIGKGVFIDHGMGVVIGETAIVGDYTLIYQGVTLGGTGKETGKRHPTIGKNVVVGAGAKVLGNIQVGDRVRIGAHSVVLRDVLPDNTVVGIPGRNIPHNPQCSLLPLEHAKLPDVDGEIIRSLLLRIENLEKQVQTFTYSRNQNSEITKSMNQQIVNKER